MCLGIPGKLVARDEGSEPATGSVDFGGVRRDVCLTFVPEASTGDYVIVHVGFAISVLDEEEAHQTLEMLSSLQVVAGQ